MKLTGVASSRVNAMLSRARAELDTPRDTTPLKKKPRTSKSKKKKKKKKKVVEVAIEGGCGVCGIDDRFDEMLLCDGASHAYSTRSQVRRVLLTLSPSRRALFISIVALFFCLLSSFLFAAHLISVRYRTCSLSNQGGVTASSTLTASGSLFHQVTATGGARAARANAVACC